MCNCRPPAVAAILSIRNAAGSTCTWIVRSSVMCVPPALIMSNSLIWQSLPDERTSRFSKSVHPSAKRSAKTRCSVVAANRERGISYRAPGRAARGRTAHRRAAVRDARAKVIGAVLLNAVAYSPYLRHGLKSIRVAQGAKQGQLVDSSHRSWRPPVWRVGPHTWASGAKAKARPEQRVFCSMPSAKSPAAATHSPPATACSRISAALRLFCMMCQKPAMS